MSNFSLDVSRFAAKAGKNMDRAVAKLTMDLFKRVIYRTPVLTGRARHNWFPSVGVQSSQLEYDKFDTSGAGAWARAQALVMATPAGKVVWLTNNLPYIRRLEHGWSKLKAPAGMVGVAVAEVKAAYRL